MTIQKSDMMKKCLFLAAGCLILILAGCSTAEAQPVKSVFSRQNLLAWCIVPFDAKIRTPEERADMLDRLGFTMLAYDWRDEHISEFDDEVRELGRHGISMTAFWWGSGMPESRRSLKKDERMQMQLDCIRRNNLKLEVWITCSDHDLGSIDDEEKFEELAERVDIFARVLAPLGCRLGLYNHGGWGGQPHHMVEIMKRVRSDNVGIVYNFHHGHEHLDMMPAAFGEMLPYLLCVNLNGMNREGPKILPLGQGPEDEKILRMIKESGYSGPIGIIGHIAEEDVEVVLKRNLEGLKKLLVEIGDDGALETYR
jgi:sugar phosphate isomerase/epimerase